jgi:hypothetical protein
MWMFAKVLVDVTSNLLDATKRRGGNEENMG